MKCKHCGVELKLSKFFGYVHIDDYAICDFMSDTYAEPKED